MIELFPGEAMFVKVAILGFAGACAAICAWCIYALTRVFDR